MYIHGKSVIVGRGSNFILQPQVRVSVRIFAPFDHRSKHVADQFGLSLKEAERRITQTESRRRSFIRRHFNTSIADHYNYDMMLNSGTLGIDGIVDAVSAVVGQRMNFSSIIRG